MSDLAFSVLGPIDAQRDSVRIDLGSPKQKAVLAMLLMRAGEPISVDQLIDGLWGERPPESAHATLQAYISNLRKAIEPDRRARAPSSVIVKNGGGYQISAGADQIDSCRFETLLESARLAEPRDPAASIALLDEALRLWRGPPYADFRYDEFTQAEAARLEELKLIAVESRIGAELALGRAAELVPDLETLVSTHPLRERLWGHLMLALYRAGRQAEALRAYRRCEEVLDELGIVPGEELRDLELAILNHSEYLSIARVEAVPSLPDSAGLIGRRAERKRFAAAVDDAKAGLGSVLLFEGEAGVGKTRLLEEFQRDAEAASFTTGFARCVEVGGSPPFWPWAQLLRQLGPERMLDAAGNYARYLHPLLPIAVPEVDLVAPSFRVAEGVMTALQTVSRGQPLALVIDDIYSADPDSLSVLTLLATEIREMAVIVVCTHRDEKPEPGQPLYDALPQLTRLNSVSRHLLRPLDNGEVRELVAQVADGHVPDETIETINERSGGNAFYAIELTRLLESEQCLSPDMAATILPGTVLEVIGRKLDRLPEDSVRLIRTAAVYGREFDLSIVGEAVELDLERTSMALDDATAAGLIVETSEAGRYRFSHMIAVNSIVHSLGSIRRSHVHELIADAIERRYTDDPTRWVEIAHHRGQAVAAAGPEPAISALTRAADHAIHSNALELAEGLMLTRHDLILALPNSPHRTRLETGSLSDLCRVWTWREGYHSSKVEQAGLRLWELTGLGSGRVSFNEVITSSDPVLSALQARFSYAIVSGDMETAIAIANTSLGLNEMRSDPMIQFASHLQAVVVGVHRPDIRSALESSRLAIAASDTLDPTGTNDVWLPLGQQPGRITLDVFSAWAHWMAGDREQALSLAGEARQLADQLGHPFTTSFVVSVEGLVAAMDRSPEWVLDALTWARSSTTSVEFGLLDAWGALLDNWATGMKSDTPKRHADILAGLLDDLAAGGATIVHTLYRGMLAELELRADRPRRALSAALTGIELSRRGERFWYPELERLASEALRSIGDEPAAKAARARALEVAIQLQIVPVIERLREPAVSV